MDDIPPDFGRAYHYLQRTALKQVKIEASTT
jgi:hypothetical protein